MGQSPALEHGLPGVTQAPKRHAVPPVQHVEPHTSLAGQQVLPTHTPLQLEGWQLPLPSPIKLLPSPEDDESALGLPSPPLVPSVDASWLPPKLLASPPLLLPHAASTAAVREPSASSRPRRAPTRALR
jgi:hypothetical protein